MFFSHIWKTLLKPHSRTSVMQCCMNSNKGHKSFTHISFIVYISSEKKVKLQHKEKGFFSVFLFILGFLFGPLKAQLRDDRKIVLWPKSIIEGKIRACFICIEKFWLLISYKHQTRYFKLTLNNVSEIYELQIMLRMMTNSFMASLRTVKFFYPCSKTLST